jgi:hypothetical protein
MTAMNDPKDDLRRAIEAALEAMVEEAAAGQAKREALLELLAPVTSAERDETS